MRRRGAPGRPPAPRRRRPRPGRRSAAAAARASGVARRECGPGAGTRAPSCRRVERDGRPQDVGERRAQHAVGVGTGPQPRPGRTHIQGASAVPRARVSGNAGKRAAGVLLHVIPTPPTAAGASVNVVGTAREEATRTSDQGVERRSVTRMSMSSVRSAASFAVRWPATTRSRTSAACRARRSSRNSSRARPMSKPG